MRPAHIAVTAILTIAGFVAGFVVAVIAGYAMINEAECDGPCFGKWEGARLLGAVGFGLLVAFVISSLTVRRLKRSDSTP